MKIPTSLIEAAASKEASRYTLQAVNFDATKKHVEATDGTILVRVPVETAPEDASGLIPLEAFRDARRSKLDTINVNGKAVLPDKREYELAKGTFPNTEAVIPKDLPAKPTICIDPDLLVRLADALVPKERGKYASRRVVALYINNKTSAVYVRAGIMNASKASAGFGLIMPVRSERFTREDAPRAENTEANGIQK